MITFRKMDFHKFREEVKKKSVIMALEGAQNPLPKRILEVIHRKYPNRPVSTGDPSPIIIDCDTSGPYNISGGFVMCDKCGRVIRSNYLPQHKESGACRRIMERRANKNRIKQSD